METEWRNSFTGPCSKPNPNFLVMHSGHAGAYFVKWTESLAKPSLKFSGGLAKMC